ncbi:MAG: sigma-54-dependent Fis family transcriptional regulator [bacterium]|nr:sigma-54-dependent Fis family transcriptional regulator [bacterium]
MLEQPMSILIVDDEPIKRSVLADSLGEAGYRVAVAASPLEADPILADMDFDVVLTDLRMPGQDGLSFLRELKARKPDQHAIVMTAYGTVDTAVEAMKLGAFDYILKPFSTEELLLKLDTLGKYDRLTNENEALRQQLALPQVATRIIGQSEAIRKVLSRIHAVAGTDSTVLVEGESGTGKELVARMIHEVSPRATGPFVAVLCASLPRDLLETELFGHEPGAFAGATKRGSGRCGLAGGGTILRDDVDDIPLQLQVKLLRVLQEKTFERVGGHEPIGTNARLVAATKRPLLSMVASGTFREDLYYRLNVVPVPIPPLRDRLTDIPLLTKHFLQRLAVRMNRDTLTLTDGAMARLQSHHWPGNVRELEHVLERMAVLGTTNMLDEGDLPDFAPTEDLSGIVAVSLADKTNIDLAAVLTETEARIIRWAMTQAEGNIAKAAEKLGIPRTTLQYKMSKFDQGTFETEY